MDPYSHLAQSIKVYSVPHPSAASEANSAPRSDAKVKAKRHVKRDTVCVRAFVMLKILLLLNGLFVVNSHYCGWSLLVQFSLIVLIIFVET